MNGPELVANFPEFERLVQACEDDEDFRRSFGTEEACREWFQRARWPTGFVCPRCGRAGASWHAGRRLWLCPSCRKQTSLTSGTLLERTKKPLRTWFEAAYLVIQRGVNARTLQRELRLTYKVAWAWAHRLRGALRGREVPVNAGARERRVHEGSRTRGDYLLEPHPARKDPCACSRLVERDWGFPKEPRGEKEAVAAVFWRRMGYKDEPVPEDSPPTRDARACWELLATYAGSVTEKHLRAYLDELAFRGNRRARPRQESFFAVARALATEPPRTYRMIVARPATAGHALSIWSYSRLPERTEAVPAP